LTVTLNPGHYALLFGSGQFGASESGGMHDNNTDIPGSASYFAWSPFHEPGQTGWHEVLPGGLRFVVTGTVIPEPGAGLLAAVATALLVASMKRSPSAQRIR
jgi:hypothetical protein